jgi:hypothetical protein
MIWARNFVSNRVAEIPEYFVYCGIFARNSWDERAGQITKGEFLEMPKSK